MVTQQFEQRTRELIDSLKAICAAYGLGNDGNEFKIITQVFLYKFLNDKFAFEAKKIRPELAKAESWEAAVAAMSADDLDMLQMQMGPDTARLKPEHFIAHLFGRQNAPEFAKLFDDTLRDIAITNNDIFAVKTDGGAKITLFDRVSEFITDPSKRDAFCRALINKLGDFSFERIFNEKYDFYAALFEYLIKDYNKDSGGKYAEYYTPHAVAKIMAAILVPDGVRGRVRNVSCYDPSAGSGTLLMNIAHATNVSILFIDAANKADVVLIDASGLGTKVKDGKNQKTLLSTEEEDRIIATFNAKQAVEDFSVVVSYDDIATKNYSLSAGQYFEVKIEYVALTKKQFKAKMNDFTENLDALFKESANLERKIKKQLAGVVLNG